jgi:energy-converting hydrogenase Eha subunit H
LWCGYIYFILIDLVLENIYIEIKKRKKKKKRKIVYLSYLAARWSMGLGACSPP